VLFAVRCYVVFVDIHSVIKLSLQSLVMAVIVLLTCSTVSRLIKPATSRLYRLFTRPALPGVYFYSMPSGCVGVLRCHSWQYFSRLPRPWC